MTKARLVAVVTLALALAVGSGGGRVPGSAVPSTRSTGAPGHPDAVGKLSRTFVDRSRRTPANGEIAAKPSRTLETSIYYPAEGPAGSAAVPDARAAPAGGPFPLVVLAHGFGGSEDYLAPLATAWASAGYVVAVPHFPLTYAGTPGGINGSDVQRQPGDMSFVVDEVLAESRRRSSPISRLVDASSIGLAGHSNGAITTLGAVANTCCRDPRAKVAVVLSGVTSPYAGGRYELSRTPPMLFVHGVNDTMVSYNEAVKAFNAVKSPKALLTLEQSDHGRWLRPDDPAFPVVTRATTDFLDGYLRGDPAARRRLGADQAAGLASMHFVSKKGSNVTVPTLPQPATDRKASVSATKRLGDGQVVTVRWSGFLPGGTINIVQCAGDGRGGSAACDITAGRVLQPDPAGDGSMDITVHTGRVGDGVCDARHPCTIVVNDSALQDRDALLYFPITFAP